MRRLLTPLSWCYQLGTRFHRSFYDGSMKKRHHFEVPVISVGNITWGGAGKTPLVLWLAEKLKQDGKTPAVLMRGVGSDEVKLYQSQNFEVGASPNRVAEGEKLLKKAKPDVFLLDDGFQHWPIYRNLDIVCLNAMSPFGNGRLIPSGSLREPVSALKRADVIVLTHADQVTESALGRIENEIKEVKPEAAIAWAKHEPIGLYDHEGNKEDLKTNDARPFCLISGLGSPGSFEETAVNLLGRKPAGHFAFKDHHPFKVSDVKKIMEKCGGDSSDCVISEKDWVRSPEVWRKFPNIKILKIKISFIRGEEILAQRINHLLESRPLNILALSDGKTGHLKQSLGLVDLIKTKVGDTAGVYLKEDFILDICYKSPFHQKILWAAAPFLLIKKEKAFSFLGKFLTPETMRQLEDCEEHVLHPDWIVSAGSSLLPVQIVLQKRFGNKAIIIMKPSGFYGRYPWDLVIQPLHDGKSDKKNVVTTELALGGPSPETLMHFSEPVKSELSLGEKRGISLFVGGNAPGYQFSKEKFKNIMDSLQKFSTTHSAPYFVTTSRRTPKGIISLIKEICDRDPLCKFLVIPTEEDEPNTVEIMLGLSHTALITEESVSMISEALQSGRHVVSLSVGKRPLKGKKRRFTGFLQSRSWIHRGTAEDLEEVLIGTQKTPHGNFNAIVQGELQRRLSELL